MKKTRLTRQGNSHSVIIPKTYLKLMGVTKDTRFKIMTDGQCLILKPIKENDDG